jgi:hypothetical protein
MFICPHCNKEGIAAWKKSIIIFTNPPCCKFCGKPSGINSIYNLMISITILMVFFLATPFSDLGKGNWINLLLFLCLVIGLNLLVVKFLPLVALDETKVRNTKIKFRIIQWIMVVTFVSIYFWGSI